MIRQFKTIIALLFFSTAFAQLNAQKYFQMLRADAFGYTNKQMMLGSYEFGWRRICFTASGGFLQGTDKQSLLDADVNDPAKKEMIRESQSVFPETTPSHSHLEFVNSTYTGTQFRFGFTVFFRNNDTLARHPMTGPHIGASAVYSLIKEQQDITYKADSSETEYFFSGINEFHAIGASTAFGWQFAMFKARLYMDLRVAYTFYYPFMPEPNLNSPFAGNRVECSIGLGWHFVGLNHKDKTKDGKDDGTDHQGGGIIRSNI